MARIIQGNLLKITKGAIVHQVNLQRKMGAGLAKQIRDKYPRVFEEYERSFRSGTACLGLIQPVWITRPTFVVINLFGQVDYGRDAGLYTMADAHRTAWPEIKQWCDWKELKVYAPWKIGCGLGGGDWEEIRTIAEQGCPEITWVQLRSE